MNIKIVKDLVVDVVDSQVEERLTLSRIPSDCLRCHVGTDHLLGDARLISAFDNQPTGATLLRRERVVSEADSVFKIAR